MRLILIFIILISGSCFGQNYTNTYGNYDYKNNVKITGSLMFTNGDTVYKPPFPGAFGYKTSDKKFYSWNGLKWSAIALIKDISDSLASNIITLSAGASSYTVPANTLIEKFFISEPTSISFDIGTSVGGTQIVNGAPITTGVGVITVNRYFASSTTIYFTNSTVNTAIKIYKN